MIVVNKRYHRCSRCGIFKSRDQFYRHRDHGRVRPSSWCKLCKREATKKWRAQHPERAREQDRRANARWYAKPEKRAIAAARTKRWQAERWQDPMYRLAQAEMRRMRYRERAEREGRTVRALPVKNPWTGKRMPVWRLEQAIKARGLA